MILPCSLLFYPPPPSACSRGPERHMLCVDVVQKLRHMLCVDLTVSEGNFNLCFTLQAKCLILNGAVSEAPRV
eukprot:1071188-Pleurochrysis_carterae.AAC.1